jgi:hypothetical protein
MQPCQETLLIPCTNMLGTALREAAGHGDRMAATYLIHALGETVWCAWAVGSVSLLSLVLIRRLRRITQIKDRQVLNLR